MFRRLALGLMMLATASSEICGQLKDGAVVTAVSYITRNAAPPAGTDTPVVGKVKMMQSPFGGPICMYVYISGLPPCSTHGFHIHEGNDTITDGCQSTGGHYNPFKKTHGGPQDIIRHVGDLGNLKTDCFGVINTMLSDHLISLVGPNSVIGRAFVKKVTTMLVFASGLMMLATTDAKIPLLKEIAGKILVTAECSLTRNAEPPPGTETPVKGTVKMFQLPIGGPTTMFINISGLPPSTPHGFHIHEFGDVNSEGCQSTGSHYNPLHMAHGAPQDKVRHVGDLGNLISNPEGVIIMELIDPLVSLVGPLSVIGRAFVIHEEIDDLGRGTGPESLKTGSAGARLGCGVIYHAPLKLPGN